MSDDGPRSPEEKNSLSNASNNMPERPCRCNYLAMHMHVWQVKLLLVCTCCQCPSLHVAATNSPLREIEKRKGNKYGRRCDESNRDMKIAHSHPQSVSYRQGRKLQLTKNENLSKEHELVSQSSHTPPITQLSVMEALLPQYLGPIV